MPITGNKPIINVPLDEENNENETSNGNERVNIPLPPNTDVKFDKPDVKVPSQFLTRKIITNNNNMILINNQPKADK